MPKYRFEYEGKEYFIESAKQPSREELINFAENQKLELQKTEEEKSLADTPIADNPEEQAQITEESLYQNPEWIDASKEIYFWEKGKNAPELESDKDYVNYGLNYMGQFNYNLFETGQEAVQLSGATQKQKESFVALMDLYDAKAPTLAGFGRFAKGVVTDPSTYLGVGLGARFVGQGGKEAIKQSIREAVKKGVKEEAVKKIKKDVVKEGTVEGIKRGATVGAAEGSVYATLDNIGRQNARINAGVQKDFDWQQLGKSSALGAGLGVGFGGAFGGVAGNLGTRNKFTKGLQEEQRGLDNPNISKQEIETRNLEKPITEEQPVRPVNSETKPTLTQRLEETIEPLPEIQARQQEVEAGLLGKTYQRFASKVIDTIKKPFIKWGTFGDLKDVEKLLTLKGLTGGKLAKVKDITRDVYDFFSKLTPETNQVVRKYLIGDADLKTIQDPSIRSEAKQLREGIDFIGNSLAKNNILSQDIVDKNKGTYLPRMYLKYLDKKGTMDYTKTRKDLDDATLEFLGEVQDVSLQGSKAIEDPMTDIIKFGLFEKIAEDPNWTLRSGLINFRGKEVSPVWLNEEKLRITDETAKGLRPKKEGQKLIKEIDELIDEAETNIAKADLTSFKKVPDSKQYGSLRGAYIRKEIYDDLIASGEIANNKNDWVSRFFSVGPEGGLTKVVRLWKMTKVALNPPSQVRNFISNGILVNLSGVAFKNIPRRYMQAWNDIRKGGPYFEIAKKYGITDTTFTKQEMLDINKAYLKLKGIKEKNAWTWLKIAGTKVADTASNIYQFSEILGKTAKIIDMMAKGSDEATAALAAQKTLFDYSSIPPAIRFLRNAPIGVPFVTFYYKVLPNLLETAIRYPERIAPYYAIPFVLSKVVESYKGVTSEDVEKVKESMGEWAKDNNNLFLLPTKNENGNWDYFDYSYFLPWSMYTGIVTDVADGEIAEAFKNTGILSGPVTDIITAIRANKDPFTGYEIVNEYDPPNIRLRDMLNYAWRLAGPPWLTDRGFLGKMIQAINKDVDKYEDVKVTKTQALLRLIGVNIYSVNPEKSRKENLRNMQREYLEMVKRRNYALKDKNLTPEERENLKKQYDAQLKSRKKQLDEFKKESKLSENIKK
jgi:hypothetical protein